MTDLERARHAFYSTTFATEVTGCVIDAVGDGYARCSMALTPAHKNSLGVPMGGAVFTLADFAFGVASNFDRDVFVSSAAEIHFLTASQGKILTAEAKEIRTGRQTCLFAVTVTDDLGKQVAYVTVTGMKVGERKKK
ncbi:MAG: PaaI family thioesterase [Oscillospiraceae bacterium]|nr:PaaI family thioesterase [Oscillospiraceae bacterium]